MESKGKRLKRLIAADNILVLPGIFDGFSARIAESAGFGAGFITGSGVSEASLGMADVGVMGLADNVHVCRHLTGVSSLPLIADGDTGYGNAVNVHFATRDFEAAGVAGVMFEDQAWPKRCGHMAGKEVIDAGEAAAKIRAAREAAADPDFVVMARTDAIATHGIEEAVQRLCAYREAGADLLFADALMSEEDIATVASRVPGPLCVNMGFGIRSRTTTPLVPAARLRELGVASVMYPRLLTAAAIKGMQNAISALKDDLAAGRSQDRPDLLVDFEEINRIVGLPELKSLEERYLTADQKAAKYGGGRP